MNTGSWVLSVLGTLIILGLIVALVVWALSRRGDDGSIASPSDEGARGILDRRLSEGDLTVEQYEQLRETLGDDGSTHGPRRSRPASAHG